MNTGGFGAATSTTLGGAPIQGVEPPKDKAAILAYKLKTNYKEWEFAYWPVEDQQAGGSMLGGGGGNINGNTNSVNGPGSSNGATNGSPFNGNGNNGSSTFGNNGSTSGGGFSGGGSNSGSGQNTSTTPQ